ncbi:MAG: beta-N-acetylhexosaminidase [Ferruginibacter sp.]
MKINTLIICLLLSVNCFSQLNIVPMPAEIKMGKGSSVIKQPVGFILIDADKSDGDNDGVEPFKKYLKTNFGLSKFVDGDTHSYGLATEIFFTGPVKGKEKSYYEIEVTGNKIYIKGTALGKFYAFETLKQMITVNAKKQIVIPNCTIKDYPRFQYRGMHLDVGRHFFPVSFIKKYIDYLATYKYNTFHWHLTEDQGWRIEIKKYPELTKTGAWRNGTLIGRYPGKGSDNKPYGGFYTQAQIKEVVQYAKDRYIDVIPEIEMPGHSSAAIAAYSWLSCFPAKPTEIPAKMISQKSIDEQKNGRIKLVQETWGVFDDVFCAGKDSTFVFLQNVIDEVLPLFPSKYFHIGGDESPKTHWKICPACQKRIKDYNLKDEHELQSWFVQRIEKYLNGKGKTMIGWDEILEGGLAPNAVVMSWRGEKGGIEAAKQKHQVIMTPGNPVYFDHTQSKNEDSVTFGGYNPIENVYAYEPVAKELNTEQGKYILGAQANMWTEYQDNIRKIEYQMFPRMTALSEVLWSPKEKRDWKDFERRLPVIFERLDKQKINYSKAYYDLKATVLPTENYQGVRWQLETKTNITSQIRITYPVKYDTLTTVAVYNQLGKFIAEKKILSDRLIKTSPGNKNNITVEINDNGIAEAELLKGDSPFGLEVVYNYKKPVTVISQKFSFNKASGKKITIITQPDKKYPGDGAFTLVNGVQNEKGMAKSSEFLGFNGTDLDVTIDLGKEMDVSKVTVHVLKQTGSWIYLPSQVEVTYIPYIDTTIITRHPPLETITVNVNPDDDLDRIEIKKEKFCRYIQVRAKNYGIIPAGKPGAGNPAWLFVDEIEVQ